MPTKEEVKSAYRNLKNVLKAISEDKDIPQWRKQPLIDKLLDKMIEFDKYLAEYLDEEDYK